METNVSISRCRAMQEAFADRTRGLILNEFLISGELTASMVAERVGLTFTNVSYHVRRMRKSGIIELTREVTAGYRTERFYRISSSLMSMLWGSSTAITESLAEMTIEERQAAYCTLLAVASSMLARASERYKLMDADAFDQLYSEKRLMMIGLGTLPRVAFEQLVRIARAALPESWGDLGTETQWAHPDYMIFAALPELVAHSNGDRS